MISRRTFIHSLSGTVALSLLPQDSASAEENAMAQEQEKEDQTQPEQVKPGRYGLQGKIAAQPGKRDELLSYLLEASRQMEALPACELYVVSVSPTDPDAIWVYEVWHSEDEHDASLRLESTRAIIAKARPLIAGGGERTVLIPMGGKGL